MKRFAIILLLSFSFCIIASTAKAQCSVCTRTAQQLGEKPARGLNAGILYLAFAPIAIIGIISYRFIKKNK
jgi:hypothetical protein